MDKNTKQGHEESREENYRGKESNNHSERIKKSVSNCRLKENKTKSPSEHSERTHTHSRSRSPCSSKNSKRWMSSNAFINFVQDVRQIFPKARSTKVYQVAGERWRKMSSEEKQPYIKAALNIKNQKQNHEKNKSVTKLTDTSTEQTKNENSVKVEKTGKKGRREKKPKKRTKEKSSTESDTDSNTSGTTLSKSSRDVSDTSS
ncbi:unnamed protein product [Xylocopa violacea]|uniref:HMG box domain-containing protein n=1 Tax=Xylocopa violacea TaxID=135666 RepID=A0ABP1P301_XYLVO